MGDPNFKTDAIDQTLQIVLKDIFVAQSLFQGGQNETSLA